MSTTPSATPASAPGQPRRWWRWLTWFVPQSLRSWLALLLSLVGILIAYYVLADRYTPMTTDAYMQAFVVQVAPQVEGRVVKVAVREGQQVKAGDLLFELDARPFEHRAALNDARRALAEQEVKALQATLEEARAEQQRAEADAKLAGIVFEQEQQLNKTESTTQRQFLEAQQKYRASQAAARAAAFKVTQTERLLSGRVGDQYAQVAQAAAQQAESKLHLSYTRVVAPCDGLITDLQLREGAYVHTGQAALTLIDNSHWQIVANFRENALAKLAVGQSALVSLRSRPGKLLPARVVSVGWGVGQGQGVPSGMLPEIKRSTSWIPPSQRFQVRLQLLEPEKVSPRIGLTGAVSVYSEPDYWLNSLTEAWHQALAWLDYL